MTSRVHPSQHSSFYSVKTSPVGLPKGRVIRVRPVTFIVAGTDGDDQRRELFLQADDAAGLLLPVDVL